MQIVRQRVDENMPISHPIKPHNVQKSKGLRSKRAFGKDLTNQQGRNANNANQKHGSKPSKANEDADLKKDEMKPQLMVVDQVEVAAVDEDGDDDMSEYSQDSQVTPEPVLKEWDAADLEDDLCVPEYAEKIMDSLKQQEAGLGPFMDAQKDVNARMRAVLVDWLIEVHRKFKLSQQTYFLAINMVDRYLADHSMVRTKLQLLGTALSPFSLSLSTSAALRICVCVVGRVQAVRVCGSHRNTTRSTLRKWTILCIFRTTPSRRSS